MLAHDDLTELFMRETETMQKVIVEEMAERTMSDVMHEGRDA